MTTEKNKPAETIRGPVGSGLKLTLWENQSDDGSRIWHTGTLTRSYQDQAGQWHDASSIDQRDFLEVAEMYREAHAFAKERVRAHAEQQRQDAPQAGYAEQETQKRAGGRQR